MPNQSAPRARSYGPRVSFMEDMTRDSPSLPLPDGDKCSPRTRNPHRQRRSVASSSSSKVPEESPKSPERSDTMRLVRRKGMSSHYPRPALRLCAYETSQRTTTWTDLTFAVLVSAFAACDLCFNKKIKCDMLKPVCSNCVLYQADCKTTIIRRKANAPKEQPSLTSSKSPNSPVYVS